MPRSHILKGFSDIESALWVHNYNPGLTIKEMVKAVIENGFSVIDTVNYEVAQLLHEWGLTNKNNRCLTIKGENFYDLWQTKRNVATDVLHGLQYVRWTKKKPGLNIASWAYKTICDYLWFYQSLPENNKQLVSYIHDLRSSLSDFIPPKIGDAFSNKSINDAYDWILPLEPPVLHGVLTNKQLKSFKNTYFKRRAYCSPALFIMAIAYVIRESEINFGDLVLLDDDRKQVICSYCFIEDTSFDTMLDESLRQFNFISLQKEWDTFVVLLREPEITDFLEN